MSETTDNSQAGGRCAPAPGSAIDLDELLYQITPLPWTESTMFPCQGKEFWANQAYRRHAANMLPELLAVVARAIDAMRTTQRLFSLGDGHVLITACKALSEKADKSELVSPNNKVSHGGE